MEQSKTISSVTRRNWILDAVLFTTALVASVSGIYFLVFPDGGYKGGRNPYYGIQIIFEREGWEWIHTWISLGMIAVALIHLVLHWKWVGTTTKRLLHSLRERKSATNSGSKKNILVDVVLALAFILCAISGVYLFLVPEVKGDLGVDPMILFSRTGWDNLHTWSSIAFISAALIHFTIHWGWVIKVAKKMSRKQNLTTFEQISVGTN